MDVVDPPVATSQILICDKCGKRMQAGYPSRELVARLEKTTLLPVHQVKE